MDDADRIAAMADAIDGENQAKPELSSPAPEPKSSVATDEAAENRAEGLLKMGEWFTKAFVDRRLYLPDEEVEDGRSELSPLIAKWNLQGSGTGRVPYEEEARAGFFLGGLAKRFSNAVKALRAEDRAKQQEEEQQYGDQRADAPTEQAQSVSGNERVREESDPETPGWLAADRGAGGFVGQQQGSSSS